jgi:hypothetical protein
VTEITANPLCWPNGWRRTPEHQRTRAKFGRNERQYSSLADSQGNRVSWNRKRELTIEAAITRVLEELERMGIQRHTIIISSDLRLRNDGLPYSTQNTSRIDQGAAVYWKDGKHMRCMAIDRYDRIADNLGAIAATIEAMRAIERHGGAEILDRAFTGFAALPAPADLQRPHEILGVDERASRSEIEYAYKRLAAQAHPDKGGSNEQMSRINTARDAMLGDAR